MHFYKMWWKLQTQSCHRLFSKRTTGNHFKSSAGDMETNYMIHTELWFVQASSYLKYKVCLVYVIVCIGNLRILAYCLW